MYLNLPGANQLNYVFYPFFSTTELNICYLIVAQYVSVCILISMILGNNLKINSLTPNWLTIGMPYLW